MYGYIEVKLTSAGDVSFKKQSQFEYMVYQSALPQTNEIDPLWYGLGLLPASVCESCLGSKYGLVAM